MPHLASRHTPAVLQQSPTPTFTTRVFLMFSDASGRNLTSLHASPLPSTTPYLPQASLPPHASQTLPYLSSLPHDLLLHPFNLLSRPFSFYIISKASDFPSASLYCCCCVPHCRTVSPQGRRPFCYPPPPRHSSSSSPSPSPVAPPWPISHTYLFFFLLDACIFLSLRPQLAFLGGGGVFIFSSLSGACV